MKKVIGENKGLKQLASVAVLLLVVTSGAMIGAWASGTRDSVSEATRGAALEEYQPTLDPSLGIKLDSEPAFDKAFGAKNPETKDRLVIVAGTCGSCSLKSIGPSQIDWKRYDRVVAIYQSEHVDEASKLTKSFPNWKVVPDAQRTIAHKLNAAWMPRLYVFDGKGSLKRIQGKTEGNNVFGVKDANYSAR